MLGQVIRRDEADNVYSGTYSGDPHEVWYRFNGRQIAFTGNNGTLDTDYPGSIFNRMRIPPQAPGAFRFGATSGTASIDFDPSLVTALPGIGRAFGKAGTAATERLVFRSTGTVGPAFDPAKLAQIQAALEKRGVSFVTGEEGARLAKALGGEALYIPEAGVPGILALGPNPTRTQVIEELLHYGQHKAAGFADLSGQVVRLEIEAQNRLLQVGPRLGWTQAELAQIARARAAWLGQ